MYTKIDVAEFCFYQCLVETICNRALLDKYGLVYSHALSDSRMHLDSKCRSRFYVDMRCCVFSADDPDLSLNIHYHVILDIGGNVKDMMVILDSGKILYPKELQHG